MNLSKKILYTTVVTFKSRQIVTKCLFSTLNVSPAGFDNRHVVQRNDSTAHIQAKQTTRDFPRAMFRARSYISAKAQMYSTEEITATGVG